LYQNILCRDPEDQAAIENLTTYTRNNGIPKTINAVFTTNEFKLKNLSQEVVVDKLYRSILGREADGHEKEDMLYKFRRGDSIQKVVNDCVGGAEYRLKVQNNTAPDPVFWPE
jgi:hypothetical protein